MGTLLAGPQALFGPGEIAILLSLLFIAVRHYRPLWAVVCGTLNGVALLLTPVRHSHSLKDDGTLGSTVGGLVLIGLVAGPAAYLCSLDYGRTVAASETRREEHLAIVADLHDFVARHVTGILVPPGRTRHRVVRRNVRSGAGARGGHARRASSRAGARGRRRRWRGQSACGAGFSRRSGNSAAGRSAPRPASTARW